MRSSQLRWRRKSSYQKLETTVAVRVVALSEGNAAMLRFLFLKVDETKNPKPVRGVVGKASIDPRLLPLMSARYV